MLADGRRGVLRLAAAAVGAWAAARGGRALDRWAVPRDEER